MSFFFFGLTTKELFFVGEGSFSVRLGPGDRLDRLDRPDRLGRRDSDADHQGAQLSSRQL